MPQQGNPLSSSQRGNPLAASRRIATVNSSDPGPPPTMNINLAGDTTNPIDVPYLGSYTPVVNDFVVVLSTGGDHVVIGSLPQVATSTTPGTLLADVTATGGDDNNLGTLNTQRIMPACVLVQTFTQQTRVRVHAHGRMWGQTTATPFNGQAMIGYYSGSTAPTDGTGGGNISPAITEINAVARPVFRNPNVSTLDFTNFVLEGTVLLAAGTYTFIGYALHSAGGIVSGVNQDLVGRTYLALYHAGVV